MLDFDVQSLVVNELKPPSGGMSVGIKQFSSLLTSDFQWGYFGPRGHLTMFTDLCLLQLGVGVIQRVEASDVAKLPTVHRTASHSKDLSASVVSVADVGKPALGPS